MMMLWLVVKNPAGTDSLGTWETTDLLSPPRLSGWHVFMAAYGRYELILGQDMLSLNILCPDIWSILGFLSEYVQHSENKQCSIAPDAGLPSLMNAMKYLSYIWFKMFLLWSSSWKWPITNTAGLRVLNITCFQPKLKRAGKSLAVVGSVPKNKKKLKSGQLSKTTYRDKV